MVDGKRALALLALGVCLGAGCAKDPKRLISVDGLPVIGQELNFGTISVGTRAGHSLELVDDGRAPVQIASVEVVSGRQDFLAHSTLRVVPGLGGKAQILVQFHPETEGPFNDELIIHNSSLSAPDLHVALKGVAGPADVRFDPPLLDWGGVELSDERTLEFWVDNPTDLPLALTDDAVGHEFELSDFTAPPNARTHFTATFHSRTLGGRYLKVHATPCATCTVKELPGQALGLKSALQMDPDPVTFAGVPVHHTADQGAQLKNLSWRDVGVRGIAIEGNDFQVVGSPVGVTLAPGQSTPVVIRYLPQHQGPTQRRVTLTYKSFALRTTDCHVQGVGGGPQISVTPRSLVFDDLPVGGKERLQLYVSNAGTYGALTVTGADGAPEPFEVLGAYPFSLQTGDPAKVILVDFAPEAPGDFQAEVHLHSNDIATPDLVVPVSGKAHPAGPCSYKLTPSKLDFGNVPPGDEMVLGFRFENTGQPECAVKDIHLEGDNNFFMPGGALVGGALVYQDAFSAQVAIQSPGPGVYTGDLVLTVNDPAQPLVKIPLVAHSEESCLVATPGWLDFGIVRFDCEPHPTSTILSNICDHPVTVTQVEIGEGTLPEFVLTQAPAPGTVLDLGQTAEIDAEYKRTYLGQQYSPLYVSAQGEPEPLLIPLLGETVHEGLQYDRFVQGDATKADVLFVVSNTNTMAPYQQRLLASVHTLVDAAQAQGLDLHLGVTTTGLAPVGYPGCGGGAAGGEAGRLFPADGSTPRLVTLGGNALAALQANLAVGTCQTLEQGLEAMRLALSSPLVDHADDYRTPLHNDGNLGFLRAEARLAIVVVADEDDHSGFLPDVYEKFIHALKGLGGAHRSALYALVPQGGCQTAGPPGPRFAAVAQATGGATADVCDNDYGPFLAGVAAQALGAQAAFHLTATPDAAGVKVYLDGQPADGSDWYYDANSDSVVFNPGHLPQPGTLIEVDYRAICQ